MGRLISTHSVSTFANRRKNYFLKSLPSKIFKTTNTQAKQTEKRTNKMTVKTQINNDLTMTEDRRPAYSRVDNGNSTPYFSLNSTEMPSHEPLGSYCS